MITRTFSLGTMVGLHSVKAFLTKLHNLIKLTKEIMKLPRLSADPGPDRGRGAGRDPAYPAWARRGTLRPGGRKSNWTHFIKKCYGVCAAGGKVCSFALLAPLR